MNRFAEQRARGAVALGCAVIASFWLGTARAEEPPLRIGLSIDVSAPSTDNRRSKTTFGHSSPPMGAKSSASPAIAW
jgi:hypothetical protein